MEIPNKARAYIPKEKIDNYLLSETHSIGKSKARYFRSYGYSEANISDFENGLIAIAQTASVTEVTETPYGTKYVIDGNLPTPNGVMIVVRTVWIIELGEENPRLITAHPLD